MVPMAPPAQNDHTKYPTIYAQRFSQAISRQVHHNPARRYTPITPISFVDLMLIPIVTALRDNMHTYRFASLPFVSGLLAAVLEGIAAQSLSYSPLRPPAVPLAVRNPYMNVWSATTVNGGALNSQTPTFWTNESVGWEGIVVVDDIAYEYLGNANRELPVEAQYSSSLPLRVLFDSQSSNFTFRAGPVTIEASFLSPVTPKDVCRSSIPLSYLTTSVRSDVSHFHTHPRSIYASPSFLPIGYATISVHTRKAFKTSNNVRRQSGS
jgi:hypothetical protein